MPATQRVGRINLRACETDKILRQDTFAKQRIEMGYTKDFWVAILLVVLVLVVLLALDKLGVL